MAHRRTTLAYGMTDVPRHSYALEDWYGFSRNHTKSVTIKRWKRHLKSKARQANRRRIDNLRKRGNYED